MKATALRASILQLAIQGKLVPQLEAEPAVEQIGEFLEDVPFAIPEKWKWVRIPEVLTFREGPGILKCDFQNDGVPLIRIAGMRGEIVSLDGCNFLDPQKVQKKWSHFRLELGDVVISSSASLDKVAVVDEAAVGAIPYTGLILFRSKGIVNLDYFVRFVKSPLFIQQVNHQKTGGMIKHFGPTHLQRMYIPVPPQEEQRRIVERLNELLPLVDAYGKEYEALLKLNKELPGKLRASILQEAIQGKLVPQLDEEPAVEQIGEAPEEVPFVIPEKWKWVQIENLADVNPRVKPSSESDEVSFLPMASVGAGYQNRANLKETRVWSSVRNGYTKFADQDIILAKITPCFQNRKSVIVEGLTNGLGCGSSEFHVLRARDVIDSRYLLLFLKTDLFIRYGVEHFKGTAGQQRLGTKDLKECLVPLPPLEEQKRIVNMVDLLLSEVDRIGN